MGKSTAARFLRERGAQVVDTDELAHQLVEPGQPALAEIQAVFGRNVVAPGGQLRRDELAQIVFADPAARKKLEAILHPRIQERWHSQIETWRKEDRQLAVVVIPLLFETNVGSSFDKTVCVGCSTATQRQRLLERGWTAKQIEQRIAAQMPVEEKIARSDFVIWTEGDMQNHSQQIDRLLASLNR